MSIQKTYRIKINFTDGTYKWIQANQKKLVRAGNVIKYVRNKYFGEHQNIKQIIIRCWNNHTNKYYSEVCFDTELDYYRKSRDRIEVTYKWNETERMYIGRSTGWIPIYLAIKRKDSSGGGGLLATSIKKIRTV